MEIMMQIQIAALVVLFIVAAMLSLAETSLIGMSRIKIIAHIRNSHKRAKYLKVWMKEPNKLLATLSICINAVAIGASTIGAFLSLRISSIFEISASLTATAMAAVITVIIIIFGEISPKIFAIHNTEKLGLALVKPIVILYKIIKPITEIFVRISNLVIKMLGGKPSSSIPVISAKDISTVIDVSLEEGYIGEQEKSMMASLLEFGELQAKHAMVPRTSIVGIDIEWEVDKIIDLVIEDGYSRMPVFKDNLDNIIGILYTKDMLTMIKNRGLIIFQDLIRMPYYVPETKTIADLLKEFKKGKIHMAIVTDEYGGTAGLITLEDILEEIVGEIQDEYDMEDEDIRTVSENIYIVDAKAEIDKLNDEYSFDIPEEDDINTIGGFVLDLFDKVPKVGEKKKFGNICFEIVKSDARKIEKLKIIVEPKETPDTEEEIKK